ncbi:MAG TPA: hypothetical protein VLK82_24565 [Candidatus Tectomicrobia bacterium]|nr:hypothetical protein [Candidatus Tectomicrobia bacterium]
MIRGHAVVKGNIRRPRKGATVYRRPEVAVVFGALEANPGGALFEGSVSDLPSPAAWHGGLLIKGTFTADPIQQGTVPSMKETQRLALALLCYVHLLAKVPNDSPELRRWGRWAQNWLEHRADEPKEGLTELLEVEWPYPGLRYLVHAGYQLATGTVLRDITSTVITQAMTDLVRIADQHALQIDEEVLAAIVQQSRRY